MIPTIRRYVESDFAAMASMGREFIKHTPMGRVVDFDEDSMRYFLNKTAQTNTFAVFVAEHEDRLTGCACAVLFPPFFNLDSLLAQELFWWVEPEFRGGPSGRMLREEMENWAWGLGARSFCMLALENENLERVGKLYRRFGYAPVEHTFSKENPWV